MARDAQASGDPVAAENYLQHAEHYYRLIASAQEQFRQQYGGTFPRSFDEDGEEGDDEGQGFGQPGLGQDRNASLYADDGGEGPAGPPPGNQPYGGRDDRPRYDRGDRQNDRGDRGDRQNDRQGDRPARGNQPRFDRNDRNERFDRNDRNDRYPDRNDRPDRQNGHAYDRASGERPQNADRPAGDRPQNGERYDRNERGGERGRGENRERYPRGEYAARDRGDRPEREPRPEREARFDRGQPRERFADQDEEVAGDNLPAFLTTPVLRSAAPAPEPESAGAAMAADLGDAPSFAAEDAPRPARRRRTRKVAGAAEDAAPADASDEAI